MQRSRSEYSIINILTGFGGYFLNTIMGYICRMVFVRCLSAEYLGVKPGTIRDWIRKEKGIPAHKIGKQWKFKRSELDDWVNSGKSAIN